MNHSLINSNNSISFCLCSPKKDQHRHTAVMLAVLFLQNNLFISHQFCINTNYQGQPVKRSNKLLIFNSLCKIHHYKICVCVCVFILSPDYLCPSFFFFKNFSQQMAGKAGAHSHTHAQTHNRASFTITKQNS